MARVRAGVVKWLAVAAQCIVLSQALAAPEDDHRRGMSAYHRGDVASAIAILRVPANGGHAPSQSLLAFILDRGDFAEEAARLYEQAAAQGDAEALAALGNFYLTGRGVAKDEKRALEHFSKAAEQGHELAMQVLADAHIRGQMGLDREPRDFARAQADLRRAADIGHLPAAEALERAHRQGGFGLQPDATQADRWRARVAEIRAQRARAASKARP
jgi:TPR repeat protein